jgi:hypothetical protein
MASGAALRTGATFPAPRPVVLVAVGQVGRLVALAVQRRGELRRRFGVSRDGEPHAVEMVLLDAEPGDEQSAVAIRTRFLERGFGATLHRLQDALNGVRSHRLHTLATMVEPSVYVIAATWEPVGAALLWPLADIAHAALGSDGPHRVHAVVVAAVPAAAQSARTRADALSFVSFSEGDTLARGAADWRGRLGIPTMPGSSTDDQSYDHLYLLDGLKANGATVTAALDLEYIIEHAASIMDALFISPAEALLDQNLLDDFKPLAQQTYVGAGTASLVVPLAGVSALLQDHAVGAIVLDRLINVPADPASSVAVDLVDETTRSIFAQPRSSLAVMRPRLATRGLPIADDDLLFVDLDVADDSEFGPRPLVVSLHTDVSLRELVAVPPAALQERLRAEIETGTDLRIAVENALEADGQSPISASYARYEQVIRGLLREGDLGLIKAQRLLKGAVETLGRRAQNLDERREDVAASRHARSVRAALLGERRWFYDVRRLRPIADMRPQLLSVAARCALGLVLLSQFYSDSFRLGRAQWPFDTLIPRVLGSAAHDVGAASVVLALPFLLLAAVLLGLPELALRAAVLFHRRTLLASLRLELPIDALSFLARQHRRIAALLEDHEQQLAGLQNELRSEARRLVREPVADARGLGCLDRSVVQPRDIVSEAHQQHVVSRALQTRGGRALQSWLLDGATSGWDIKSSDEVLADIRMSTEPSVAEFLLRPVDTYIHDDHHGEYLDWAWGAAVPWAREAADRGEIETTLGNVSESVNLGLLLVSGGTTSPLAETASTRFDAFKAVDCGDPFRVQLLRLQLGIPTQRLARYAAWRLAFQLQTAADRDTMTDDVQLKSQFPSIVPEPAQPGELDMELQDVAAAIKAAGESFDAAQSSAVTSVLGVLRELADLDSRAVHEAEVLGSALTRLDEAFEESGLGSSTTAPRSLVDRWLRKHSILPVEPMEDTPFQATDDGHAPSYEASATVPPGNILRVLRRGYRREPDPDDQFLVEPRVIVSSGSPGQES